MRASTRPASKAPGHLRQDECAERQRRDCEAPATWPKLAEAEKTDQGSSVQEHPDKDPGGLYEPCGVSVCRRTNVREPARLGFQQPLLGQLLAVDAELRPGHGGQVFLRDGRA